MKSKLLFILLCATSLFSQDSEKLDTGNTAWVIVAMTFVMLMSPAGLALFYGGMTRSKNLLNTIAMNISGYIIASVVWIVCGFSIAFGTDFFGLIGFDGLFLSNIKMDMFIENVGIPKILFVAFQMTFAGITLCIISGAVIERMKFSTWLIFSALWVIFVYSILAHWIWGEGFLFNDGVLEFAGGTVVHINAGIAGLIVAIMLGKRADFGKAMFPSSITLSVLGAILLWFGWFGFNGGSALSANSLAANAILVTNISASLGALAWILVEYIKFKKFTLLGMISGVVAGLVGITPAAGFVDVFGAITIGVISGIVAFYGVHTLKKIFKYDDSLDAFGIHGVAGIWGAIATGIFANPHINPDGIGFLYGNHIQLWIQIKSVLITIGYSALMTFIVFKVSCLITKGGRVSSEEESQGIDELTHGEKAFNLR